MKTQQYKTFEEAWQKLFEALPTHDRLEIVSDPKGTRAARHAKEAMLAWDHKANEEATYRKV